MEEGDFYEGDMILPEGEAKNHISDLARRWPNGVVPYVIDGGFSEFNYECKTNMEQSHKKNL